MHYGGLLLQTRRENIFEAMQRDSYNRQYTDRNKVFNHPLDILPAVNTPNYAATTISGDKQYISMPGLWRNYNDVVGYYRDQRTKGYLGSAQTSSGNEQRNDRRNVCNA